MKKLYSKLLCGGLIASAFLISASSAVSAAGTAAEYTYSSNKISGVANQSSAEYAYVSSGVLKKMSYSEGDYTAFDETAESGGVTYSPVSKSVRYFLGVFSSCSELKQVVIENGIEELPYSAFFYNKSIEEIVFPENSLSFETETSFYKQNGTSYYWYAPTFGCMTGLERYYVSSDCDVTLPYGTKVTYDFNDGSLLYSLKDDGTYEAVYALPGNEDIKIAAAVNGKAVTSIAPSAFSYISGAVITIPESVETIDPAAFDESCSSLTIFCKDEGAAADVSLYPEDSAVVTVTTDSSKGTYTVSGVVNPENLTVFDIPEYYYDFRCISIGDSAFAGCSSLVSVTIPLGAESLGEAAFYGCSSLEAIEIVSTVSRIGENCFTGCPSMTVTCSEGSAADNSSLYPEGTVFIYTVYLTAGDINGDGAVNAADAVMILRYASGDSDLTEAQLKAGDVNGDEAVNAEDAELIVKYDTGEIPSFN